MLKTNDVAHAQRILICDFGSQYTQLIARRVRELGVYCEIFPYDAPAQRIKDFAPRGVILSGGPESVHVGDTHRIPDIIFHLACPILGICYGMQALADQFGGNVIAADISEFGHAKVTVEHTSLLLEGMDGEFDVWMSHGDQVKTLPEHFILTASTSSCPIAAIESTAKPYYGVQFHPEVTHTPMGMKLLNNFVSTICSCEPLWNTGNIIEDIIDDVKEKVGSDKVLLGLSGGVDSSVVAALLHKAIGQQLICVFVDNGLLRLNEAQQVMDTFAEHMGVHVIKVDAEQQFLQALGGVTDPEEKRKIVGREFVHVFQAQADKLTGVKWLAQGTIYPDVIESAGTQTGKAKVIKSHHNVGGLPETLNLQLIEPLRELFKDEVRQMGLALGLPDILINRHPFPGPGLCVRIIGDVKKEYADILRQADAIFIEELHRHHWYDKVSQAFVVFLPVKSVGVTGDGRRYDYVVSLRAVETTDFMTAHWSHLPYELLSLVSNRIINEIPRISRVTYDISGKPPATIEWE